MIQISNHELARIWSAPRSSRPEPGIYAAPAAVAVWDGQVLTCRATGQPLEPDVAMLWPFFASALRRRADVPPEPTIAALEADYNLATAAVAATSLPEPTFRARLATCRGCLLWTESARQGRGRCDSVRCTCSRRALWLAEETCPQGLWPAA